MVGTPNPVRLPAPARPATPPRGTVLGWPEKLRAAAQAGPINKTPTPVPEGALAHFYYKEAGLLQDLLTRPDRGQTLTVRTVWNAVAHATGTVENDTKRLNEYSLRDLGYLVTIHSPLEDGSGRWARNVFSQAGNGVATEYSESRVPDDRVSDIDKVIVQGKRNCLYGVDPARPGELIEIPKPSAARDLAIGPEWQFFLKLGRGAADEAVLQIKKTTPNVAGMDDPAQEIERLNAIRQYFSQLVLPTINAVRERGEFRRTSIPVVHALQEPSSSGEKRPVEVTEIASKTPLPVAQLPNKKSLGLGLRLLIKLFWFGSLGKTLFIRVLNKVLASLEHTKRVEFYNARGQRISAYLTLPKKIDPRKANFAIIPPGFGTTKEYTAPLAEVLRKNGIGSLRFDGSCSVGESEGEMADFTMSGSTEDILSAHEYLSRTLNPRQIGLVPMSLSSLPAIKSAATILQGKIGWLAPLVGVPNLESILDDIVGKNVVSEYLGGQRVGPVNVLGYTVKSEFLQDAARGGFLTLASTLQDLRRIDAPIAWFCAGDDAWVSSDEVKRALADNQSSAPRKVFVYQGVTHKIGRHTEAAKEIFLKIAEQIIAMSGEPPRPLVMPKDRTIARAIASEWRKVTERTRTTKQQDIQNWAKYLEGFDALLWSDDYVKLLDDTLEAMNIQPGDRVLDVGCGTGNLLTHILGNMTLRAKTKGWGKGELMGVDFVDSALERAREKAARAQALREDQDLPGVRLERVDMEKDEIPGRGKFTKIAAPLFLSYVKDAPAAVRKMVDRLEKGGTITLTSLKPGADPSNIYKRFLEKLDKLWTGPDREERLETARNLLHSVAGFIEHNEVSGRFTYFSAEDLAEMLQRCGVEVTEVKKSFGGQAWVVTGRKRGGRKKEEKLTAQAA